MGSPVSPTVPQLSWSESGGNYGLSEYSGSDATTLIVTTPYSTSDLSSVGTPIGTTATIFYNAELVLTPSETNQAGTFTGGGSIFSQALGPSSFEILSGAQGSVLLAGTINSAYITGMLGMSTGSVVSWDVTYSSGLILNAAEGLASGDTPTEMTGPLSWSLLNAGPAFHEDTNGILAPFTANATGQFAVPEPATTILLMSIAPIAFFFIRRRFRRR